MYVMCVTGLFVRHSRLPEPPLRHDFWSLRGERAGAPLGCLDVESFFFLSLPTFAPYDFFSPLGEVSVVCVRVCGVCSQSLCKGVWG
jgi:hypothetical protein